MRLHLLLVIVLFLSGLSTTLANSRSRFVNTSETVESSQPSSENNALNIAAWNIFKFGSSDISDSSVRNDILDIMEAYDIVYVQEITDLDAGEDLLDELRDEFDDDDWSAQFTPKFDKYAQAYYWKNATVHMIDSFLYDHSFSDSSTNSDFRNGAPFCAQFRPADEDDDDHDIGVIGLHANDKRVEDELDGLVDAHEEAEDRFDIDNFVLYGDFNADCREGIDSLCDTDLYDEPYVWMLDQSTETDGKCRLDRLVVTEDAFVHVREFGVYDFRSDMSLSKSEALDVSDHLPVWVQISEDTERSSFTNGRHQCSVRSPSSVLKTWHIVLIALGAFLLLAIIVAVVVFAVFKLRGRGGDKYNTKVYRSENVESV